MSAPSPQVAGDEEALRERTLSAVSGLLALVGVWLRPWLAGRTAGLPVTPFNLVMLVWLLALLVTSGSLAISVLLGFASPGYEPSLEVQARGEPDLHDLVIALASGMAAAYAVARPNVAATLRSHPHNSTVRYVVPNSSQYGSQ